jgi:hypothetical protein
MYSSAGILPREAIAIANFDGDKVHVYQKIGTQHRFCIVATSIDC